MSSFTQLTYHAVFSTKYRHPLICDSFRERFYEYIGGTIRNLKGHLIEIGGVEDHLHLLATFPPTASVSDLIRDIKANASRWVNEQGEPDERFEWQKGYACFTVSYSHRPAVQRYIRNQQEHHRKRTFREEYIALLKKHDIAFDEKHLFEAEYHG
jgi:putative transposase